MWSVGSVSVASKAHGAYPSLCNLFGCSGSSTDQSKALFGHGTFVLVRQKTKINCHLHVENVDLCLYREWFITLLSIREHTPHMKLLYNSVLVSPIFTVMFSFVSLSGEVYIRSLVRFLHDSSPLGNLLLVWHGRERGKRNHTWVFQALLRWSFQTLSYVVVCLHHISLLSLLATAAAWGLECIFCRNSPLFSRRWTSLWHFRWQFPCLWANLYPTPVPSKRKVLPKTLTSISRP